jgi:hypothetical protein
MCCCSDRNGITFSANTVNSILTAANAQLLILYLYRCYYYDHDCYYHCSDPEMRLCMMALLEVVLSADEVTEMALRPYAAGIQTITQSRLIVFESHQQTCTRYINLYI